MYNIQDVYGWPGIDNKLHQIKINVHYSIWNHPSKELKWRENQDRKEMPIYSIDMKMDNGRQL